MLSRNIFQNKLPSSWRQYAPGGVRPKVANIPFNGVLGPKLRAMGTKRVGVLPNKMFSRKNTAACFAMSYMPYGQQQEYAPPYSSSPVSDYPESYQSNIPGEGTTSRGDAKLRRLELQQELQQLKRERLKESRELQALRERDLVRKRIADTRKSYRAYVLDTSKETRGWLREAQGNAQAAKETAALINQLRI